MTNPIRITKDDIHGNIRHSDPAMACLAGDAALLARYVKVTLDGEEQLFATVADEHAGEIHRFERGEDGQFIIDGDAAKIFVVKGEVKIGLRDDAGPRVVDALKRLRAARYGLPAA